MILEHVWLNELNIDLSDRNTIFLIMSTEMINVLP